MLYSCTNMATVGIKVLSLMVGEWSTSFRLLCYVGPFILAADINQHEVLKLFSFNFYTFILFFNVSIRSYRILVLP